MWKPTIQPSVEEVSGELIHYSSSINSSSVVQISSGMCHKSVQTSYSSGIMLEGGFLASYSLQYVGRHSLQASHHKGSHHGNFIRPGAQVSATTVFNPLAAQSHVLHRQGFSSSVFRQW